LIIVAVLIVQAIKKEAKEQVLEFLWEKWLLMDWWWILSRCFSVIPTVPSCFSCFLHERPRCCLDIVAGNEEKKMGKAAITGDAGLDSKVSNYQIITKTVPLRLG
jgi:hypothetical protein